MIFNYISLDKNGNKIMEIDYNNDILYFDIETFECNNKFVVYAAGYDLNGKYNYFYGKNALQDFIAILLNNQDKKLCAYNGGRFDYIILIKGLIENNVNISDFIKSNGRLLQYIFNGNSIFDLYNFTMTSLKNTCDDYKISKDKCKSEFDHNKKKSWADVELYRSEILPYLELDLISMKELFITINKEIYELIRTNITN